MPKLITAELPDKGKRIPNYVSYIPLVEEFAAGTDECCEVVPDKGVSHPTHKCGGLQ